MHSYLVIFYKLLLNQINYIVVPTPLWNAIGYRYKFNKYIGTSDAYNDTTQVLAKNVFDIVTTYYSYQQIHMDGKSLYKFTRIGQYNMSFRKFGGIRFSSKNNYISCRNLSPAILTIGKQMGQINSELLCDATLNMNNNSIINVNSINNNTYNNSNNNTSSNNNNN